jgi:hypothetical protein
MQISILRFWMEIELGRVCCRKGSSFSIGVSLELGFVCGMYSSILKGGRKYHPFQTFNPSPAKLDNSTK